jgi:hypothetical protein
MGVQFFETMKGKKFFDYDFPQLCKSLDVIHRDNEKLIEIKEAELKMKRIELALKERESLLKEKELILKEREILLKENK